MLHKPGVRSVFRVPGKIATVVMGDSLDSLDIDRSVKCRTRSVVIEGRIASVLGHHQTARERGIENAFASVKFVSKGYT